MNLVWNCARKDLRRLLRDPLGLVVALGIPLFIGAAMTLIFGGGSARPQGRLLIADRDDSFLSRLVAGAFQQGPLGETFQVENVKEEDGRRRMNDGDASALVVIPKGFSDQFLNNKASVLTLVKNPSQQVLPQMVEESLRLLAEGGFYVRELTTEPLQRIQQATESRTDMNDTDVVAVSLGFKHAIDRMRGFVDPPRIKVETEVIETKGQPSRTEIGLFFFPGMMVMALLFTASGYSDDLWKERTRGTLLRSLSTPSRLETFLAGKLLAISIMFAAIAAGSWLLGMAFFSMPFWPMPVAVGWLAISSAALYLLFALLQTVASSQRGGALLAHVLVMPLVMLGGAFFPPEMMPATLALISRFTPNGIAQAELKKLIAGTVDWPALAVGAAGFAVAGAAAFWITVRRLRTRHAL